MDTFRQEAGKIWKTLVSRIHDKYRLVILSEETFEEKLSFKLSRLNVFVAIGLLSIILVFITSYIIAFTPLRVYIPGYTDITLQKRIYSMQARSDSLQNEVKSNQLYLENLKRILYGENIKEKVSNNVDTANIKKYQNILDKHSPEDSLLRADYENQNRYNLFSSPEVPVLRSSVANNLTFFTPLKGIITNEFNLLNKHYGVDLVANKDEAIKASQDGTVIFAAWTVETGYVIALQHAGNIITVYKHNSVLLKHEGAYVRAGEPIAVIGETGEQSTGPHLHFELWINGNPVNPKDYVIF
jgi:murein DD-endopeptidase MepM/ murein hydrolase activator NlpD